MPPMPPFYISQHKEIVERCNGCKNIVNQFKFYGVDKICCRHPHPHIQFSFEICKDYRLNIYDSTIRELILIIENILIKKR